jgi:hypothetical protein
LKNGEEEDEEEEEEEEEERGTIGLGWYDAVRLNIFCLMKDIQVMPELLKLIC